MAWTPPSSHCTPVPDLWMGHKSTWLVYGMVGAEQENVGGLEFGVIFQITVLTEAQGRG